MSGHQRQRMPPQLLAAAALACILALSFVPLAAAKRAPTEVSTNAVVTSLYDLEHPEKDGMTRCEYVVNKSKDTGAKRIGIVITISAQGSERTLGFYQYQDGYGGFMKANNDNIQRFKNGLQKCFKAAVDAGFTRIRVLPHVDIYEVDKDGKQKNMLWRNVVRFDPHAKYGNADPFLSYEDVLLDPAVEALKAVLTPKVSVELSLAGEQGLSVFGYPQKWSSSMDRIREDLKGYGSGNHTFGLCFNWNKVCGCVEPRERDPLLYNRTYTERLQRWKEDKARDKLMGPTAVDLPGAKALFNKMDFVGVSGYAPILRPLSFEAMEISWETAGYEFGLFGISLKDLANQGKKLVYSEHGLGGCYWDFTVAPTLEFLRLHPWLGYWPSNGYEAKTSPWVNEEYKKYRRQYYDTVIQWAQAGGGPQYQIDGIYTWSVGSFDVNDVHPATSNDKGSYSDPVIAAAIKKSNEAVNAGKVKIGGGGPSAARKAPAVAPKAPAAPPAAKPGAAAAAAAAGAAKGGAEAGPAKEEQQVVAGSLKALLSANLTSFAKLANASGLTPALNATVTVATIFAPSDAAIVRLAAAFGAEDPATMYRHQMLVDRIAGYHIVNGKDIKPGELKPGAALPMTLGGNLTVVESAPRGGGSGGGGLALRGAQGVANITGEPVVAGNVTIYTLDAVLLPDNVFATLKAAVSYNIVTKAMHDLIPQQPKLVKAADDPRTNVTLLVPTEAAIANFTAMAKTPEGKASLAARGVTPTSGAGAANTFDEVLLYHAVKGARIFPNAVKDGQKVPTLLEGHGLTVKKVIPTKTTAFILLVPESKGAPPARVVKLNIIAGSSFVHLIDHVLIPDLKATKAANATAAAGKAAAANKTTAG